MASISSASRVSSDLRAIGLAAYGPAASGSYQRRRRRLGRRIVTPVDLREYLETMHRNVARRFDSKLYLITIHPDDEDANIVADHDGLIRFAAEHEHVTPSLAAGPAGRWGSFGR